jgi:hypothetical protein
MRRISGTDNQILAFQAWLYFFLILYTWGGGGALRFSRAHIGNHNFRCVVKSMEISNLLSLLFIWFLDC